MWETVWDLVYLSPMDNMRITMSKDIVAKNSCSNYLYRVFKFVHRGETLYTISCDTKEIFKVAVALETDETNLKNLVWSFNSRDVTMSHILFHAKLVADDILEYSRKLLKK